MKILRRLAACVGSALLLGGCYTYGANVSIVRPDPAPSFTQQEQETAKAITLRIGRAAGFWETDVAEKLSADPMSSPYLWFVSLGAPGGDPERRHVSILGMVRKDRRELQISVGDSTRGDPTPATAQLIEDLRVALERAFRDCQVEVTHRKKLHLLAP
jgi:hypothetical protein